MKEKILADNRAAQSDIKLDEDLSHKDELPQGEDYWEHHAFVVMGESQGNDLLLVVSPFRVGGGEAGSWRIDDGILPLTTLVILPQEQRGRMHNNDFIGNRQDPLEAIRDFQILRESDRVTWKVGNRQYISRPPYWEVKGEHLGVVCDLTMGGLAPAVRYMGPWSELPKTGLAGYDQACWAEGTISAGGKTYTIEKGFAVHERVILGKTWTNLPALLGETGYYWIWGLSEPIQTFTQVQGPQGMGFGTVLIDGRPVPFGPGEAAIEELEWWLDPKTGMRIPSRWHLKMNSSVGILDLNLVAEARGIYSCLLRSGFTAQYTILTHATGSFSSAGGSTIPIEEMYTYVEWGRCVMPLAP